MHGHISASLPRSVFVHCYSPSQCCAVRSLGLSFDSDGFNHQLKSATLLQHQYEDNFTTASTWPRASLDEAVFVSLADIEGKGQVFGHGVSPPAFNLDPSSHQQHSCEASVNGTALQARKKVQARFKIVHDWFKSHADFPHVYASPEQLQELVVQSGLTDAQVRTCLTNRRTRNISKGYTDMETLMLSSPDGSTGSSVSTNSESKIDQSVSPKLHFPLTDQGSGKDEQLDEYTFADNTLPSLDPWPTTSTQASLTKRNGKRNVPARLPRAAAGYVLPSPDEKPMLEGKFSCTVCRSFFKSAYEWERHESAVHLFHSTEWICQRWGDVLQDLRCAFCCQQFPCSHTLDPHNSSQCWAKSEAERTFFRKDHLKQHIKQVHISDQDVSFKKAYEVPDAWGQEVEASRSDPRSLWCGFCVMSLPSTAERMKHVAKHFRKGRRIVDWEPLKEQCM